MVDEYQDTNALQGDITYLLGESHRNVMAMATTHRSIYGFRGASHENIMDFPKRFPECKVITLAENYRSTQAILNVANTVLEGMTNRHSKRLVAAKGEEGVMPQLLHFKDAYEEADWVAGMIKRQMDEGIPLHHQAVALPFLLHLHSSPGGAEQEKHPLHHLRGAQIPARRPTAPEGHRQSP
ncbi:MAG: ATP-dependent helicase [Bacillus subtilis]|nr:ATP-dependent helicase [Bacillus subtilis]